MMRPTTPAPEFEKIPAALRACPRWVLWSYEERDGRWTKVPKQPDGANASSTDSTTWSSFEAVRAACAAPYDGVGFMLQGSGLAAVDLDHVIVSGLVHGEAARMIQALNTYTEMSPSGEGIRILLRGALPEGWRKTTKYLVPVEMYDDARYVTITGRHFPTTPSTIEDRGVEIASLHGQIASTLGRSQPPPTPLADVQPSGMGDDELLARAQCAKNGQKFQALWKGDTSAFNGDDSAADMALVSALVFWSGRNVEQVDRLFRRSGLMREKWDSPRPGGTYGSVTIAKAIERGGDAYREVFTPVTITERPQEFIPIPQIAQCGLAHDYALAYSAASGVDYAYWYFSFMTTLLAAVSQKVRVERGLSRPVRLWTVLIGPPNSGKSMTRDLTFGFIAGLKGITHDTEIPARRRNVNSDKGMLMASDGVHPLLLMPDEFSVLVKKSQIEGATLSETLLELFEKEDIDSYKDRQGIAQMIHLSVLSGTTPKLFEKHLDTIAAEGGLLSRLWLVPPTQPVQFKSFHAPPDLLVEALQRRTRDVINHATWEPHVLDLSADAKRALSTWMRGLGPTGMTGHGARIDGYARRLAAGFAVMRGACMEGRTVEMFDMVAALGLCEWQLEMRRQFTVDSSDSKSAKWSNAIRRFIKRAVGDNPGAVVRDIDVYRGVHASDWGDPALYHRLTESLVQNLEIEAVSVPGRDPRRPARGWRIGENGLVLTEEPTPAEAVYSHKKGAVPIYRATS